MSVRIKVLGRQGVWILGRTWSFSYWPPRTWLPLGIREGWYGRSGWWGAACFTKDKPSPVVEVAASVPVADGEVSPSTVGRERRSNAGSDPDARAVSAPARPNSPGVAPT